jgi:secreted trypsin-like serine protease
MSIPAFHSHRCSLLATVVLCTVFQQPAAALVGRAQLAEGDVAQHVVMIKSARGGYCTGTVLAPHIALTAAHCVWGKTEITVSGWPDAGAESHKVIAVVAHPLYDARSYAKSQAAIDLALLKLESPLRETKPVILRARVPLPGERFGIAGFGLKASGSLAGPRTLQTATLIVVGEPSSLQLRLVDPASRGGAVAGLGSCYGDSGGPVFEWSGDRFVLIGLLSWSNGPNMSMGCGGFTGVTPLVRHRGWIIKTAREMGSILN